MSGTALISGVNSVLGSKLHQHLLSKGWIVIPYINGESAMNKIVDHLDLLVIIPEPCQRDESGVELETSDSILKRYNDQTLGAMRIIQLMLPSMQSGLKRIVFITDPADSTSDNLPGETLGCAMASAATQMLASMIANELSQEGFTVLLTVWDEQSVISQDEELPWCRLGGSR